MGKSKFLRVECPQCKQEQILYSKSSTKINCGKCNFQLTQPTGGKMKVKARVGEVLWN